MNIVILFSGGLDSLIMYHVALSQGYNPTCVFFDIGQPYAYKEIRALPDFVKVHKVDWLSSSIDLKSKDNKSGNIYIPGRNLTLSTLAASIYTPDEIWLGALAGETHDKATDKNYKFLDKLNNVLEYVFSPFGKVVVKFPLADMGFNKFDCVQWGLENGMTVESLHHTSSCLSEEEGNCGHCVVCCRRWGIFGELGIPEKYNVDPLTVQSNIDMFIEMLKENSYYDMNRKREVLPYLRLQFPGKTDEEISNILKI